MAYNKDTDYQALINQAVQKGDYYAAAQYEQSRNEKIADLDASGTNTYGATATNKYSQYLMPNNYTGSSNNVYTHNGNQQSIQQQMNQNSIDWWSADATGKKTLEEANRQLAAQLGNGVTFNSQLGTWSGVADQPTSLQTGVDFAQPTFDYDAWLGANPEPTFNYEDYLGTNPKPTYNNQYQERIDALLNQILNREEFSYDVETDPLYQQYKKQYIREGNRALNDTLATMASGAGGMNTWAATAAQQANDYYMTQLNDKIPELYQLAYSMYMDDLSNQRTDLSTLQGLEQTDYGKYRDQVSDWYTDYNNAYGQYRDDRADWEDNRNFAYDDYRYDMEDFKWGTEYNYNYEQDALDREWMQKEWDYNVEQNALDRADAQKGEAYERAMDMLLMGVMPGSALLAEAGITQAEANAIKAANTEPVFATTGSSSGSGGGSGGKGSTGGTGGSGGNGGNGGNGGKDDDDDEKPVVDDTPAKKETGSVLQKPNASKTGNVQAYTDSAEKDPEIDNRHSDDWVTIPGHGRFSWTEVEALVNKGTVKEELTAGGKLRYTWVG